VPQPATGPGPEHGDPNSVTGRKPHVRISAARVSNRLRGVRLRQFGLGGQVCGNDPSAFAMCDLALVNSTADLSCLDRRRSPGRGGSNF
jgi:hypothetical protein